MSHVSHGCRMEDFQVIGYDAAGAELFRVTVPAIGVDDAKLVACAQLRRRPDGTQKVNQAAKLVVRRA